MFRCVVLVVLYLSYATLESPTTTIQFRNPYMRPDYQFPPHVCKQNLVIMDYLELSHSVTITPHTIFNMCPANNLHDQYKTQQVRIIGPEGSNLYILFTATNLNKYDSVKIRTGDADDNHVAATCEGPTTFCEPIVVLSNQVTFDMPESRDTPRALDIVIVTTKPVPTYYYAYNQLPAWATVVTVISTFVFLVIMAAMCCCCLLSVIRRRHRHRHVSPHSQRNLPEGPPVYSAAAVPVVLEVPPLYTVQEKTPVVD